jgi:hypothetical protein
MSMVFQAATASEVSTQVSDLGLREGYRSSHEQASQWVEHVEQNIRWTPQVLRD